MIETESCKPALRAAFHLDIQRPLEWSDIRGGRDAGATWWIHLDREQEESARWLRDDSGLDPIIVDQLLTASTRPRVVGHDGGVLICLRGVNLNPDTDPEDMISIRIWAESKRLISLQGPMLKAIDQIIASCRSQEGPRSVGALLVSVAEGLTDRMGPIMEQINETLDDLEDRVVDPSIHVDRSELVVMRQRTITLHRYLVPQVAALERLVSPDLGLLDARQARSMREVINRVTRYVEDLDAARGRSTVVQDELSNQFAEKANQRMYIVTLIAAIFLPLTLVSGLLGMNVGGIPGESTQLGFFVVTVILILLGLFGLWLVRHFKWL